MGKVTVNAERTPSQELIAQAAAETNVTDSRGRVITLKKPGVLMQFRLVKMLGDAAKNQTYTNMVLPLMYVTAIDGASIIQPQNEMELEALIQRLDDDGVDCVMRGVFGTFGGETADEARDELKK